MHTKWPCVLNHVPFSDIFMHMGGDSYIEIGWDTEMSRFDPKCIIDLMLVFWQNYVQSTG